MSYRVHPPHESIDTILDPNRKDGWTAEGDVPVEGVAVCGSIAELLDYAATYGMHLEGRVVRVEGSYAGPDHDALAYRVHATAVEELDLDIEALRELVDLRHIGARWTFAELIAAVRDEDDDALYDIDRRLVWYDEDEETGEETVEITLGAVMSDRAIAMLRRLGEGV